MSETVVAQIPKCSRDRSAMDLRCSLNLVVLGRLDRVVPSAARFIGGSVNLPLSLYAFAPNHWWGFVFLRAGHKLVVISYLKVTLGAPLNSYLVGALYKLD